ncbi:uncharacterized protein J4E84_008037 [Alternaria hordeiaustralica]|uniref:uncharacterized protein n=1 Tax=Alternaria hordeiaustralica TaxID=1187925 RepID=UPI0020C22B1F|nr:uncharacterized protein J4E84_008037 [Alternaria hordeiaustralica]KAI4680389.1 hypothetical protein J4E84_008037 [Alternaria hordeiaustralica]
MAETFFTPETTSVLAEILEPQYNGSVGRSAAWADAYAHTSEGHFSYQWHWIDTHDRQPENCSLDYARDCAKGGCVVSAIANQTRILRECIDQQKDVLTNKVWDGYIPYFAANVDHPFSHESIDPFFSGLVSRIRKDQFYSAPYMWLSCTDPSSPEECATSWAKESNKWDCDYVWSRVTNDTDLGTNGYAAGAVPIVELQISKAALRLGTWLNNLVEGAKPTVEEEEMMEL